MPSFARPQRPSSASAGRRRGRSTQDSFASGNSYHIHLDVQKPYEYFEAGLHRRGQATDDGRPYRPPAESVVPTEMWKVVGLKMDPHSGERLEGRRKYPATQGVSPDFPADVAPRAPSEQQRPRTAGGRRKAPFDYGVSADSPFYKPAGGAARDPALVPAAARPADRRMRRAPSALAPTVIAHPDFRPTYK